MSKDKAKSRSQSDAEFAEADRAVRDGTIALLGLAGGMALFTHLYNIGVIPHFPPEVQEKILISCIDAATKADPNALAAFLVTTASGASFAGSAWHPATADAGFLASFPPAAKEGTGFVYANPNPKSKDGAYKVTLGPGDRLMPVQRVTDVCPANVVYQRKIIPR